MVENLEQIHNVEEIAQFIFDKGRRVHQRIDKIITTIMFNRGADIQNLTLVQLEVIMIIQREGALSLTELSSFLNVSASSASTMVDRLVDKNILTRKRSKTDRRKILISLSKETGLILKEIEKSILAVFQDIVSKLGVEMGNQWLQVVRSIDVILNDMVRPQDLQSPN